MNLYVLDINNGGDDWYTIVLAATEMEARERERERLHDVPSTSDANVGVGRVIYDGAKFEHFGDTYQINITKV